MVKSISIDKFYTEIDRQINLTTSFTEKPIGDVIRMCRLKPYDLLFTNKPNTLILHNKWIDEYGNSLTIHNNKKITIQLNDLSIDRKRLTSTDLYEKLSIKQISSISKFLLFFNGKEEDYNSPHMILSFLGIDNYLRTKVFIYNNWETYPSLFLGIKMLLDIAKNKNNNFITELKIKKPVIFPCDAQRAWLSYWQSDEFTSLMKAQSESVLSVLK